MDEDIKKGLRKALGSAERGVARSLLRWKYRNREESMPGEEKIERESVAVADKAHDVIARRGRKAWDEIKRVYRDGASEKKENSGE